MDDDKPDLPVVYSTNTEIKNFINYEGNDKNLIKIINEFNFKRFDLEKAIGNKMIRSEKIISECENLIKSLSDIENFIKKDKKYNIQIYKNYSELIDIICTAKDSISVEAKAIVSHGIFSKNSSSSIEKTSFLDIVIKNYSELRGRILENLKRSSTRILNLLPACNKNEILSLEKSESLTDDEKFLLEFSKNVCEDDKKNKKEDEEFLLRSFGNKT